MLNLARFRLLRELQSRGTIAAVAAALSYSPSTVSRQLSDLQREAGVMLFGRDGRRLKLTGAAHVLARHADALLARIDQAEAEMAAVAGTWPESSGLPLPDSVDEPDRLNELSKRSPSARWTSPVRRVRLRAAHPPFRRGLRGVAR